MRLINWECLQEMDKLIEQWVVVDAIIADIPYWTTACKWDTVIPFDEMWKRLNKLIKPNGAIVLFGNEPFTATMIVSNLKWFKYRWSWNKKIPSWMSYARYRPMSQTEDICIFTSNWDKTIYNAQMVKRDKPIKAGGMKNSDSAMSKWYKALKKTYDYKNPTTLIEFDKIRKWSLHPTQKPLALMEYLIKTYTNKWETVLDFTMWSWSTLVACQSTNREWIWIELDENYYNIAKKRLSDLTD